ncbi:hypothetical protein GOV10_00010, partial [Candidatus Woesearchaeota archaeon]|nr:hypothetical protein [Candidatus Woesearchaeota archaeon]
MKYLVFSFVFLLLVSIAQPVEGVAIGVNRADLSLTNVLRNGYAEESFVVTTD